MTGHTDIDRLTLISPPGTGTDLEARIDTAVATSTHDKRRLLIPHSDWGAHPAGLPHNPTGYEVVASVADDIYVGEVTYVADREIGGQPHVELQCSAVS